MGFAPSSMQLMSAAFKPMGRIPKKHTGEGENVSPPLVWSAAPPGTKSFALICHDPDAPLVTRAPGTYGFVHWVLYNIPGSVSSLPEAFEGHTGGTTSANTQGYRGPMPPEGHGQHHYYFWLLALDQELSLPAGLTLWELLGKVEPNVIGMNRLVGTYSRPS